MIAADPNAWLAWIRSANPFLINRVDGLGIAPTWELELRGGGRVERTFAAISNAEYAATLLDGWWQQSRRARSHAWVRPASFRCFSKRCPTKTARSCRGRLTGSAMCAGPTG